MMTPRERANAVVRERWQSAFSGVCADDKHLADLVESAISAAVAEERERCARLLKVYQSREKELCRCAPQHSYVCEFHNELAAAIRASAEGGG